ncbi:hypothetical protein A9Q99_26020 [Gammaproteobacteria bacterium 45_16_T64]|nr:hypothetical protein A9Q99_26020 [Gammaproteobacteria bacterium 45_16_T64]
MSRPKQFNEEEVLHLAGDIFWSQGYANTSLSQLEKHLKIGRKSLYDTFGDKEQLFLRVLDNYLTIPYPIASELASWPEIEAMFHGGPPYDSKYRACLFVNTIQEFGLELEGEVKNRIKKHLQRLDRCFSRSLTNAIESNEIVEVDVALMAKYLTASLQSLSIMSKGGTHQKDLHAIADTALSVIETV